MSETNFKIEIVTPELKYIETICYMSIIPGTDGEFGVLARHIPIISSIAPGIVRIYSDEKNITHEIFVGEGFVEVSKDATVILVERAINLKDIDVNKVISLIYAYKEKENRAENEVERRFFFQEIKIQETMLEIVSAFNTRHNI